MNDFSGNLKAAAFQFMQTLYDTGVFSLICYKAVNSAINGPKNGGSILNIIAKHGVTYYAYVGWLYHLSSIRDIDTFEVHSSRRI